MSGERSEGLGGGDHEAGGAVGARHVGDEAGVLAVDRGQRRDGVVDPRLVAPAERDPHAVGGQRTGRREPEAGGGGGDGGGAAGDAEVHADRA